MPDHPLLGSYTLYRYPYRIRFADGAEYSRSEADYMAGLEDADKVQVHLVKSVFYGELRLQRITRRR